MRLIALLPILLSIAAIVLSFLCIFAGDKPNFMQNFDLLTLNTSQIGQNVINGSTNFDTGSSALDGILNNIGDDIGKITGGVSGEANAAAASIAQRLGLKDFYSAHLLDYCEGDFTPASVPNTTLSKHSIHRNVTFCSSRKSMFAFNPRDAIAASINSSGLGLDADEVLSAVDFPQKVEDALTALRIAWRAMFVLYCIGIGLSLLCLIASLLGVFGSGRALPAVNVLLFLLAFLTLAVCSAIATAIAVKGVHEINKFGNPIGIGASTGGRFLAITWVATVALLLGSLVWCVACIAPRRRGRESYNKHG